MYYPKQIPYLLDKEFNKNIEYAEYNIKELENYCMCIWAMKSKKILDKNISNNILPDACIDIVIDFVNRTICFAGFSKETEDFKLDKKIDYMGVRLKPSIFYSIYNIGANEIMDKEMPFDFVEKEISLYKILDFKNTKERMECLKNYLIKKTNNETEMQFLKITEELYRCPKEQNVYDIAKNMGYNERHIYRLFKVNFGVSPKVLLNILRLHLCLTLMLDDNVSFMDIANLCGFYDQAHFIKEIKRYTGYSPLKLLERYK